MSSTREEEIRQTRIELKEAGIRTVADADVDTVQSNSRLSNEHFAIVVVVKRSRERRVGLLRLDLERRNEGEGAYLSVSIDEMRESRSQLEEEDTKATIGGREGTRRREVERNGRDSNTHLQIVGSLLKRNAFLHTAPNLAIVVQFPALPSVLRMTSRTSFGSELSRTSFVSSSATKC